MRIRPATRADASFLLEMACEAANWHPDRTRPKADLLADGRVTRLVAGWKRPADDGVIAQDDSGDAIGACWYRVLPAERGVPGFVERGVPELTLGVRPVFRARGTGRALLRAALDAARAAGHQRVGLSVERQNFAERLYRSEGFVVVSTAGDLDTMAKTLR